MRSEPTESISDKLRFLALLFCHLGSFGVGRSRRIAGAIEQIEVLSGARLLFRRMPPVPSLARQRLSSSGPLVGARGGVALSVWRGADRVSRACSAAGGGRSAPVSPVRLCPRAAQAASLIGWSGARPALSPQRLRRPSSPALRAFLARQQARLPPSSAHAAALRVQVGRPVA